MKQPEIEEWKSVPDWPEYEVSSEGNVRRATKGTATFPGKRLRPGTNPKTGYLVVALCRRSKATTRTVHGLVARAFLGPPPFARAEVAHGDGVRANARVGNLRWATRLENMRDMVAHGNSGKANRKLSVEQVSAIFRLRNSGRLQRDVGAEFGVNRTLVGQIWLGRHRFLRPPHLEVAQ